MASPASPTDFAKLPIEILKVGSVGTLALLDRAVADARPLPDGLDLRGVRRPAVHPQPESYWGNVNPIGVRAVYDEAKRFSEAATMAYHRFHGLDDGDRADLQHVRPADAARTTAGPSPPSSARRCAASRSPCTAPARRPARSRYVDDLVRGILLLLDSTETGPINCGTEHELTMLELAELIVRLSGSDSTVELVERTADDPEKRRPDLTLARTLLGYEPQVAPGRGPAPHHRILRRD